MAFTAPDTDLLDAPKPGGFTAPDADLVDFSKVKISPSDLPNQPSQFSSGLPASVPISENPDWAFTKATRGGLPGILADAANAVQQKAIEPGAAGVFNALADLGEGEAGIVPPKGDNEPTFQPGKPVLPAGLFPLAKEKGAIPALTRALLGFTTPGNLAMLPFAPASKTVQQAFLAQAALSAPDAVGKLASAETPAEVRDAATELGVNAGMAWLMRGAVKGEGTPMPAPEVKSGGAPASQAAGQPTPPLQPAKPGSGFTAPQEELVTAEQVVRTSDGQIDPVRTAINALRRGETLPGTAETKTAETGTVSPVSETPSEPTPQKPASAQTSQPVAGATVSPAPVATASGAPVMPLGEKPKIASQADLDEQSALETVQEAVGLNKAQGFRLAELQARNKPLTEAPGSATTAVAAPVTDTVRTAVESSNESQRGQFPASSGGDQGVTAEGGSNPPLGAAAISPRKVSRADAQRPFDLIDHVEGEVGAIDPKLIKEANPNWRPVGAARKLFKKGGTPADVALNGLGVGHGVSPDMPLDQFGDALNAAAAARKGWRRRFYQEERQINEQARQTSTFQKDVRQETRGTAPLVPDDLNEGDSFTLKGAQFKVTRLDYDEDGRVTHLTLDDGKKYGTQEVDGQTALRMDKGSLVKGDTKYAPGDFKAANYQRSNAASEAMRPGTPMEEKMRAVKGAFDDASRRRASEPSGTSNVNDEAIQPDADYDHFARGQQRGLQVQPVTDAIKDFLGSKDLPAGIRVVRDETAPWGAKIAGRNSIVVNAAQISTAERAHQVILEEGLHGVWNDPAVQGAWQKIRDLVTPDEMRAEYLKRQAQGLPTDPDTIREEAAIARLIKADADKGVFARLYDVARNVIKRVFGIDLPGTARQQLKAAALEFLRNREGWQGARGEFATHESEQLHQQESQLAPGQQRLYARGKRGIGGFAPGQRAEWERIYWNELLPRWQEEENHNSPNPISTERKAQLVQEAKRIATQRASDKTGQGSQFAAGERRPVEQVKSDVDQAEDDLRAATKAQTDATQGTQKQRKQASALAAARYRTLRDELSTHPEYVAEQILKQHQAITEANQILKPMGKTVSPEDFPDPSEVAARLGPDAAKRVNELADQITAANTELTRTNRLAPKMVDRITNEMMNDGRLPKMAEIAPNAGRTLQGMTDALNRMQVDSPRASFADRFNVARKAAETYTAGKDAVTRAWGNSVAASKALRSVFREHPVFNDFKNVMKHWIGYDTRTAVENANYVRALIKQVPEKIRRQAMSVWLDAGGDESLLRFQRDSVPDKHRPVWDAALKLTPAEKQVALKVKADFEHKLDDGVNVGIIGKGRADYGVPQRWKKAPEIDRTPDGSGNAARGKPGNPYAKLDPRDPFFGFQRETPSYFDGIMAKGEPENLDIAHLVSVYDEAFHKALSSRGAIKALTEAHAQDGQPIVKLSGKADIRPGEGGGAFVDSTSLPKDAVAADGRPYVSVDHWALKGWKFAAKDSAGNPILVKGDMLVHPDYAARLRNELHTPTWMTKPMPGSEHTTLEKLGYYGLRTSGYLKASKFIGPFHIVTEALHASFHGVVPSVHDFELNLDDPKQALLSRNMMLDMGRAREMYDDGLRSAHGGIWGHVPGLGDAIVRMNNFTFNEYIPKLKMKVGLAVLERNIERYSKPRFTLDPVDSIFGRQPLTLDQIAEITGRQMDAAFGGQNWRMMGTNKTALGVARLMFVAPDFLLSRSKVIGQAFKPYNREQRIFLMAQAVGVYTLCRVLNSVFSDDKDPHWEPHNWDRVVIGKRAYSARFIVSDAANLGRDLLGLRDYAQHGVPFLSGRMGVLPKTGIETLTGKDMFTGQDKQGLFQADNPILKAFSIVAKDTAEWMTPMAVDGYIGGARKGQTGLGQVAAATFGVSSAKESPLGDTWNMARQYNLNSKDKATVLYQKQRDADSGKPSTYGPLDNLLDAGDMKSAQAEYNRLKDEGRKPAQIAARYDRTLPFTGNQTREAQFFASLTPDQKATYQKARAEQQERRAAFNRLAK